MVRVVGGSEKVEKIHFVFLEGNQSPGLRAKKRPFFPVCAEHRVRILGVCAVPRNVSAQKNPLQPVCDRKVCAGVARDPKIPVFFALWESTGKVNMYLFQVDVLFDFTYTSSYITKTDFITH